MRFGPGAHELSMKRLGWEPRVGDLVWAHWSNRAGTFQQYERGVVQSTPSRHGRVKVLLVDAHDDVNVTWRSIDTLYPRLAS